MNIAVVGADGKSGRAFVEAALHAGHTVRAGVRGEGAFAYHERLHRIKCDATSPRQVARLLKGADVVVSLLGHVKGSQAFVQTEAITIILNVMEEQGIKRIISLTGTGVRRELDKPSVSDRVLNVSIKVIDSKRIHDGIAHAAVLEESATDWTIIRVLKLTNGPLQKYHLSEGGPAKLLTSRYTVADAILGVLKDKSTYKKLPVIS